MPPRALTILFQLIQLFDPPLRDSMSFGQKLGRIFRFSLILVIICILVALVLASAIFVVQECKLVVNSVPEMLTGIAIVLASLIVNALCVRVLLEIRKLDSKVVSPSQSSG